MSRSATITAQLTSPGRHATGRDILAVAPLVLLPLGTYLFAVHQPPWQLIWLFASSIYAGLKWLTFATCPQAPQAPFTRVLAYLLLWPGMNATAFLNSHSPATRPTFRELLSALLKTATGATLAFVAPALLLPASPLAAGWIAMTGLLLTLHCGLFHVLSIAWRFAGIDAKPIVRAPLLASSLTDFWGRRWNLAFRDLAHHYVFRPLASRLGIAGATMTVFLLSGIVHDLVISVPVNAGFGWPTIYFLLQGIALLAERSRLGQHLGLGRGWTGRAFAALVVLAPLGLLFHQAFVLQGVLPTIIAIRGR